MISLYHWFHKLNSTLIESLCLNWTRDVNLTVTAIRYIKQLMLHCACLMLLVNDLHSVIILRAALINVTTYAGWWWRCMRLKMACCINWLQASMAMTL